MPNLTHPRGREMRKAIVLLMLILVCSITVWAQAVAGLGAVSGSVRDASGAIVPGADVVVSNEARGIRRTTVSSEAGVFTAPALVPADGYTLSVSLPGFTNWEASNFTIQVGQTLDFEVVLQVAGSATEVSVTAEAPLLEENKSGVSEIVTQAQIDNLPINGRRVDSF